MGKRIIQRARGRGGPRYRAPSHKYAGKVQYYTPKETADGLVVDIIHDPGRNAPLAVVKYPDKTVKLNVAFKGLKVGDHFTYSAIGPGGILPLGEIPEGERVYGIETFPGSGPKICRNSGSFATIVTRIKNKTRVKFPSGKMKELNSKCLATMGVPAGDGRTEKPWVKAGKKWYAKQSRGKLYPVVSGVKMNPVDHPFGGKTKPGIPKSVSRHAPPGRKVGALAPRRMGRRKRN
ncbi:50S ribosomal protein L2 [Candidatus Micrarchaeota archaeon RBG_16_49_10]|nr:MAG: 50S ribosomal protein L2 [Candidatus Micrarchaeota archaeon RBG_16_49_10]